LFETPILLGFAVATMGGRLTPAAGSEPRDILQITGRLCAS